MRGARRLAYSEWEKSYQQIRLELGEGEIPIVEWGTSSRKIPQRRVSTLVGQLRKTRRQVWVPTPRYDTEWGKSHLSAGSDAALWSRF